MDNCNEEQWLCRMAFDLSVRFITFTSATLGYVVHTSMLRYGWNRDFFDIPLTISSSHDFGKFVAFMTIAIIADCIAMALAHLILKRFSAATFRGLFWPLQSYVNYHKMFFFTFVMCEAHNLTDTFTSQVKLQVH